MRNANNVTRILSLRRAVILLALLVSTAPAYGQGVSLRYRWTKGESLTYRIDLLTVSVVTGMPGTTERKLEQNMSQVLKFTAEEVAADGTATLRQTFELVKMEVNGPMGRIAYDTAAPSPRSNPMVQAMRQVFGGMVGASITVIAAPDGTVRKVEGATKMIEQITKAMQDDPAAARAAEGLKAAVSDEALRTTLEQSFSKLPANPVQQGDTWQSQLAMGNEMIGRVVGDLRFRLRSFEGAAEAAIAQVGVELHLKQEIAPPPAANGTVLKVLEGKGVGEIAFDVAKGQIRKSSMRTEQPSTMTMQTPDGGQVTMQNKTTTTVAMELVQK